MNEIERRSYLDAMGIEVFYLKQPLARAKPSPSYDFPQETLVHIAHSNESTIHSVGRSGDNSSAKENARSELAKIRLELNPTTAQKVGIATESVSSVDSAQEIPQEIASQEEEISTAGTVEPAASTGSLKFKLHYFVINDRVAVLDEQPYVQSGKPDRDRLDLLRNILTALNVDYSQWDFRAETIIWPLEAAMEFDELPDEAAEQMLRGFIAQKHQSHKFEHLLVFAGSLESLLEEKRSSLEASFSMVITSSLSAMLAYPELKRQVWLQLKPLIPVLTKS